MGNCCQPSSYYGVINTDAKYVTEQNPEIKEITNNFNIDDINKENEDQENYDKIFQSFPYDERKINKESASNSLTNEPYRNSLRQMEHNLFNLINSLRTTPKKFIQTVENYKNMIKTEHNSNYIIVNDYKIEIPNGKEIFEECEKYLNSVKPVNELEKDDNLKINMQNDFSFTEGENEIIVNKKINDILAKQGKMYNYINYFIDKNVGDIIYVIIINLMNNGNDFKENRRRLLMGEEYDKCAVTIEKIDKEKNVYCYYILLAKSKNIKIKLNDVISFA